MGLSKRPSTVCRLAVGLLMALTLGCGGGSVAVSQPLAEAPPAREALLFRTGDAGEDVGQAVEADSAGNIYLAGGHGEQAYVARFDADGNLVWTAPLTGNTTLEQLREDANGNQVAVGQNDSGAFVASFDPDANLLWVLPLPGRATSLAIGDAIYVAGDSFLARVENGTLVWLKDLPAAATGVTPNLVLTASKGFSFTPDGTLTELPIQGQDLAADPNGGAVISGNGFLTHVDAQGNELWRAAAPNGRVAVDENGHTFVAGDTLSHYDDNGQKLWEQPLPVPARGLTLARGSNPTLTGDFTGSTDFDPGPAVRTLTSAGGRDAYVAQYSPRGALTSAGARPLPYLPTGVTYNGLHNVDNPTPATVASELATIKQHFNLVRTYYPQYGGGQVDVGKLTQAAGLKVMLGLFLFPGHDDWTAGDYQNFVKTAVGRGNVACLLVGNEDPQDLALILSYVDKAHADFPQLPVSSAQTTTFWLTDSRAAQLAAKVDFIAVNLYPGWEGSPWAQIDNQPVIGGKPATPKDSFDSYKLIYGQLQAKYPGLNVVVTETGWPTNYGLPNASPPQPPAGISRAKSYLTAIQSWAANNQKTVMIHNMYDDVNGVDGSSLFNYHFGLIDAAGNPKGVLF